MMQTGPKKLFFKSLNKMQANIQNDDTDTQYIQFSLGSMFTYF